MPPEILKSALLGEWYIVTKKSIKDGVTIMHNKTPIPKDVIKQIAYDYLLKGMEKVTKGYIFDIWVAETNEKYRVTVEKVTP